MGADGSNDRGQAFPIYVVLVAGVLFAAFAFFVVGQAAVTRSDAQGAADAAALAAAREARDSAFTDLDLVALKSADWEKLLRGDLLSGRGACAAAASFAAKNDAVSECEPSLPRFTVMVTTNRTVGGSVIPGTGGMKGTASATALIEPRCTLGTDPAPNVTNPPGGDSTPKPDQLKFQCKGGESVQLDPLKPGSLRALARSLFSVRLVD
ncbi:pilus assembly protein TadG-related protein [Streptomyces sp. NRRL F-2580]|uniref:pilus assembly protein TadG-related protein n=1 Tax=Streptomyces sp. NRRL F-2580 TaxID=1463841 RepID=UPI0004CB14A2|nr:pilus assembly protein TadG-related protein [Streptomyces sp. NRRL F-2580]